MKARRVHQLTSAPHGHILTNTAVWSPDSRWIVYDVRSDEAGSVFDGNRIERVDVQTSRCEVLYTSQNEACCGVVTCHPTLDRIVFIHGPEHPDISWSYGASRRCGAILDLGSRSEPLMLDAREMVPPFAAGALRGGTHVHTWSADGEWIAFTYEDQYLVERAKVASCESNQRLIGVATQDQPVEVSSSHPRNQSGTHRCALVIEAKDHPAPGSEELLRACSDAWVGTHGYQGPNGTRVERAIAFQGRVATASGGWIDEVFIVDLPEQLNAPQTDESWIDRRIPPADGCSTRRLTWTDDRKYPGIQGPRHWLRSTPDGSRIACLMRDDHGVVQIHLVDPMGRELKQLTHNSSDIGSAFSFSRDGAWIAHVWKGEVAVTSVDTGQTHLLTERSSNEHPVRPEACVWSPDYRFIAYVRPVSCDGQIWNQIFVVEVEN